jgi:hypothetical protein
MAVGMSVSLAFSALANTIEGENIAPLRGVFAACSVVALASIRLFWPRHRLRRLEGKAVQLRLTYRRLGREGVVACLACPASSSSAVAAVTVAGGESTLVSCLSPCSKPTV